MNPEETQLNSQEQVPINPDEAMANLSFATNLSQQLMPKEVPMEEQQDGTMPTEGDQMPETAPEQEKPEEVEKDEEPEEDDGRVAELELSITKKLDDIRKELKDDHKREVDELKKQIQDALKE